MMKRKSLSHSRKSNFGEPTFVGLAGDTIRAEFVSGFDVNIWAASGRSDRFYTGKPVDVRHEGRSFSPVRRKEMQRIALLHYLGDEDKNYDLHVDSDGDVVATRSR